MFESADSLTESHDTTASHSPPNLHKPGRLLANLTKQMCFQTPKPVSLKVSWPQFHMLEETHSNYKTYGAARHCVQQFSTNCSFYIVLPG